MRIAGHVGAHSLIKEHAGFLNSLKVGNPLFAITDVELTSREWQYMKF